MGMSQLGSMETMMYGDVAARLDGNNDGIPYERLPGAPKKKITIITNTVTESSKA
jgi:hypothetical protein